MGVKLNGSLDGFGSIPKQEVVQKRKLDKIVLSLIPKAPGKLNSIINTQQKLHQTCSISETATEFYLPLYENQEV